MADFQGKTIILKESFNALDAVVITAGTMESGDKARVSVLKPLDIVTTAGSAGNIIAALQTLPGTQSVGEDGRLFVRGGEANETQTFVDGIRVAQPYGATTNNLPTRGRFSPFLFSGIAFSTGGYSAEYGEALSSVLLLNTEDESRSKQNRNFFNDCWFRSRKYSKMEEKFTECQCFLYQFSALSSGNSTKCRLEQTFSVFIWRNGLSL